jgi:hypothetical protein
MKSVMNITITMKHTEVTMSKQTATEYLIQEIKNDALVQAKSTQEWNEVFKKAKQMEREQIDNFIDFINERHFNQFIISKDEAEIYYNETYGGQDE